MKVLTSLLVAAALLFSPALHAQNPPGYGSTNGTNASYTSWYLFFLGLGVSATVAALAATYASQNPASFSHN